MEPPAAPEKTAEELRKEISILYREQREITERLKDPRGIRRGGLDVNGGRGTGPRQRGFVRPAERADIGVEPPLKKRLLSAVVRLEDGEIPEEGGEKKLDGEVVAVADTGTGSGEEIKPDNSFIGRHRLENHQQRRRAMDFLIPENEHVPRVLPKNEDPSLVKRNKRMLGQLLGTLEKFRQEDQNLSSSEAYMRRSDSLKKAEQRAREESEKLRQREREQIAEKRRRDLTLRARVAAKATEKQLELHFLQWAEHQKKLSNFIRTKAEPRIYYLPVKPLEEDPIVAEQKKEQDFLEWKSARREELSAYQKHIEEIYVANVESELDKWMNPRNARKGNMVNLQETMDKELENHKLEHGPKTRKAPGTNDEEEDVEDIAGEDYMMDDVLEVDENTLIDEPPKVVEGDTSIGLGEEQ